MAEMTTTENDLLRLLDTVLPAGEHFDIEPAQSLRQAGIPSMTYIAFIAAIERRYQFSWDEEIPPETMRSVASLARFVDGLSSGEQSQ